jgi:signal peptidase I
MSEKLLPTPHQSRILQQRGRRRVFFTLLLYVFIAFLLTLPVRLYIAQPFVVSGASMTPTFATNDYLIIDKLQYELHKPERGDVVIFHYPLDPSLFYIKRIIGLPGETVTFAKGIFSVMATSGVRTTFDDPFFSAATTKVVMGTTSLASDEYFVLGDNRDASSDSRDWGPLQARFIIGRAFVRLLPLSNITFFPGAYTPKLSH